MNARPLGALALAGLLVLTTAPAPLAATDLDDDLRRVAERIEELAAMIDDATAARSAVAAEIREAAARLHALEADLEAARTALDGVQAAVVERRAELGLVRARLQQGYEALSDTRVQIAATRVRAVDTARAAYEAGGRELSVLSVAADQITSVAIAVEYLERAGAANGRALTALAALEHLELAQQSAIARDESAVQQRLDSMVALEADLDAVHGRYLALAGELEQAIAVQRHLLETLDEEIAEFAEELDGLEREQRGIKRRIAAEQAAARSRPAAVSSRGFVRPVPGAITSGFGPRHHPVLGYARLHTGVDLQAGRGQPIKAAKGGVVILADVWGGYGRTVVIDHGGGVSTLYAHQSSLAVRYGESVEAGQVIGGVGSSGLATGPHLHFEVRIGGEPVDPAPYLNG